MYIYVASQKAKKRIVDILAKKAGSLQLAEAVDACVIDDSGNVYLPLGAVVGSDGVVNKKQFDIVVETIKIYKGDILKVILVLSKNPIAKGALISRLGAIESLCEKYRKAIADCGDLSNDDAKSNSKSLKNKAWIDLDWDGYVDENNNIVNIGVKHGNKLTMIGDFINLKLHVKYPSKQNILLISGPHNLHKSGLIKLLQQIFKTYRIAVDTKNGWYVDCLFI